jgi:hypothetical protein
MLFIFVAEVRYTGMQLLLLVRNCYQAKCVEAVYQITQALNERYATEHCSKLDM